MVDETLKGEDLTLKDLVVVLRERRLLIGTIGLIGLLAAIVYGILMPDMFKSEAIVQPREDALGSRASSLFGGQLNGLANLAGLAVPAEGDRAVAIATLKSRAVIQSMIKDLDLMPQLYEARWNPETKAWKDSDPSKAPTLWQAYNDFTKNVLSISEDRKSGLVTVAVEWKDPEMARRWVSELVARTNAHLKDRAIAESKKNLSYLEEQSRKVGRVEVQQALFTLVEAEMKKLMLAEGQEEFAVVTVDPPVVPTRKSRPNRIALAVAGLLVGFALGFVTALIRQSLS